MQALRDRLSELTVSAADLQKATVDFESNIKQVRNAGERRGSGGRARWTRHDGAHACSEPEAILTAFPCEPDNDTDCVSVCCRCFFLVLNSRQLQGRLQEESGKTAKLEADYKDAKEAYDLLDDPDKNIALMKEKIDAYAER